MSKKTSLVFGAVLTVFSFFTVLWISCSKPGQPKSCDNFICKNGGYCYLDTLYKIQHCGCPTGYEGDRCEIPSVNRYLGNWKIWTSVEYSDTARHIDTNKTGKTYVVLLSKTATPTTFFLNQFLNIDDYNNVLCHIDSTTSDKFTIDTAVNFHMHYDHLMLKWGYGFMRNDSIIGEFYIKFKNKSSNWEEHKVDFNMTPYGH